MSSPAAVSPAPRIALVVWLGLALAVGASGVMAGLKPPAPQFVLLALTAMTIFAGTRAGSARAWVDSLPMRAFAALHLTRFVGFYFLYLAGRGEMSPVFADAAGIGDIIAATGALALLAVGEPVTAQKRRVWLAWNTVAMLDWLVVLGSIGAVIAQGRQDELAPLLRLPLSLLPTFLVPILIASQVFVFRRLLGKGTHAG